MESMPFEELPHTGDLQYRVTGRSKEEVFADAARALTATITDLKTVEAKEERRIEASGRSSEELLIDFLRGALDLFNDDGFVACGCRTVFSRTAGGGSPFAIQASLSGEQFDPGKHPYRTEIKAVTYHGATIGKLQDGTWEATFTLDL